MKDQNAGRTGTKIVNKAVDLNRCTRRLTRICLVGLALPSFLGMSTKAQSTPAAGNQSPQLMDRQKEIALALSACPPSLASQAAVYALEKRGYVKIRESQNGFTAIVQHVRPNSQEPQCMNSEGAQAFLPRILKVAELRAQGKTAEEIQAFLSDAIAKGIFPPPQRPGVIYMLSDQNLNTNGKGEGFPPHVMFYGTHLTNADLGVDSKDLGPDGNPKGPTFVAGDGSPFALIIVPVRTDTGTAAAQDKPSHNH